MRWGSIDFDHTLTHNTCTHGCNSASPSTTRRRRRQDSRCSPARQPPSSLLSSILFPTVPPSHPSFLPSLLQVSLSPRPSPFPRIPSAPFFLCSARKEVAHARKRSLACSNTHAQSHANYYQQQICTRTQPTKRRSPSLLENLYPLVGTGCR